MRLLLTLCALLVGAASAQGSSTGSHTYSHTAAVRIVNPSNLAREMEASPALFGEPHFGKARTGFAFYPEGLDACQPFNATELEAQPKYPPSYTQKIFVVDRGNCKFWEKVQNCEDAGASMVIIMDNVDENMLPILADDGRSRVKIPSVMVSKSDGDAIKQALSGLAGDLNEYLQLSIQWKVPQEGDQVKWELWTHAQDRDSSEFKREFRAFAQALGDRAIFAPRLVVLPGEYIGCTPEYHEGCADLCSNNYRYCMRDDDGSFVGLDGIDLVQEHGRQLCLYQIANQTEPFAASMWWDYESLYNDHCRSLRDFQDYYACSKKQMLKVGGEQLWNKVEQCIVDNGGTGFGTDNEFKLFEEVLQRMDVLDRKNSFIPVPDVIVNNVPYIGTLECPNGLDRTSCGVVSAVCAGFHEKDMPAACLTDVGCKVGEKRDPCGVCNGDGAVNPCGVCMSQSSPYFNADCNSGGGGGLPSDGGNDGGNGGLVAAVVILSILLACGMAFGFYTLYQRQRMVEAKTDERINSIMDSYAPMNDDPVNDSVTVGLIA